MQGLISQPPNHDLSWNQESDAQPTEPPRCPGIAGSYIKYMFNFSSNYQHIFLSLWTILHSDHDWGYDHIYIYQYEGSNCSVSSPTYDITILFNCRISSRCVDIYNQSFNLYSPNEQRYWASFLVLVGFLSIYLSIFIYLSFVVPLGCMCSLLWYKDTAYILNPSPLLDICICFAFAS